MKWLLIFVLIVACNYSLRYPYSEWPTMRIVNNVDTQVGIYAKYSNHLKYLGNIDPGSVRCFWLPYTGVKYELLAVNLGMSFSSGIFEPTESHWQWTVSNRLIKTKHPCRKPF